MRSAQLIRSMIVCFLYDIYTRNDENNLFISQYINSLARCQFILDHIPSELSAYRFFGMSVARIEREASAQADGRKRIGRKKNFSDCANSNQSLCISWHNTGFSILINAYKYVYRSNTVSTQWNFSYRVTFLEFGPMSLHSFFIFLFSFISKRSNDQTIDAISIDFNNSNNNEKIFL